jgi:L-fuconolactonase
MRVDAHHHVWDLTVRDQPWTVELPLLRRSFAVSDLRPDLAAGDFDATIVVQTMPDEHETRELLELAAVEPLVAGVVGWVDLTEADVAGRIAALRSDAGGNHLVGLRHSVRDDPDSGWLYREDVRRGLAAAAEANLVFELLISSNQLPMAIDAARELNGLRFVLDHAAQPRVAQDELEPWRSGIVDLATSSNVAVKLSGLVNLTQTGENRADALRPYVDTLLAAFGASRILFGSDWPVCLLAASYAEVVALAEALTDGLSAEERTLVFGKNAAAWYRLPRTE